MRLIPKCLFMALVALAIGLALLGWSTAQQPTTPAPIAPVAGRTPKPLPRTDFHIPWMGMKIFAMHADTNMPDASGKPTAAPEARRYYYLPLFAFEKNALGEVQVTVEGGAIKLAIIYDSDEVRKAVRKYLVDEKLIPADAMAGQVQTVAAES
jgi:hypothetical protein